MKITKQKHGYTMRLTDGEFAVLHALFSLVTFSDLWDTLASGERRSFSRRCGVRNKRHFLSVDVDRRGSE